MEIFKSRGVVFASDGTRNKEIDTRELYRFVVAKRELSNTAKLSVFKSVIVPIPICGHESWVMTEGILSQVQAAEIGFLRRVYGVTLRDKVRSHEIRKALNVELLLRIDKS